MASTFPVNKRSDNRLSINDPNSEYNQYLTQQQPNTNPPQSLQSMTSSLTQRAGRPRSQAAFSSHGPSSSESSQHSSQSSSSSSSSTSSRTSTNEAFPALVRYTLTDNPVRAQPPRQPAYRSKLSKQYSPSDSEDSDDEPLALQSSHQHTYMSGPAVELNSAAESLRAISRLDMDQTAARSLTPVQSQESVDTTRAKTLSVKLTLAKRISRIFGGGSKNSKKSSHILTNEAIASTSDVEGSPYQNKLSSIEIINDVLKQELHPSNMSIHQQQSHPNPEYAYTSGGHGDYQTNLRLGGVPHQSLPHVPTLTTPQPFVQPQFHSSPLLMESLLPNARDREMRGPASRRGSSGPHASPMAGPHPTHPLGAPNPGTPGPLPTESHSRRLSSNQIQTAHNSYISEANGTYSSSHGNLLNAAAISSIKSQQQQQQQQLFRQLQNYQQVQQPSPQLTPQGPQSGSQGRHRPTSRRHSGSSYFNISPQQKPYSVVQSTAHVSPFPSPVIGATGSALGYTHELSVAMQHQQYQQQQVQLQIQQQQLHNLQQQQHVQQQSPNCQVSPLALLQSQSAQQHQQQQQSQQQQIEQLQQIRMQQQQLLFQQQQQLQLQLEQARAAVTASTTTTTISPLTPDIATGGVASPQKQQQQQHSMVNHGVPLHFALPAAPVLTTAMGLGVGMNMSPLSVMGMGVGPQQPTMMPQLVMTPPLTPQLIGYTTPMYSYQQIPTSAIPARHVPVHAATGGASARSSAVMGY
ncbi:hypothetical protein KI688_007775 [Linnemannia hyalina]|uniref:Uncharacterized protein n=1 Tax=Linnemannia hyalina TaxID=64524 RepID=A0A9P7XI78_9FUNG|nr:hypothetical protein KI688_007775 [Linnemannia hyalina]